MLRLKHFIILPKHVAAIILHQASIKTRPAVLHTRGVIDQKAISPLKGRRRRAALVTPPQIAGGMTIPEL